MKIYTKTGDDGTTGLFGGERVPKNHPRVDAYGAVDELNAVIGLVLAVANDDMLRQTLTAIQADLFTLGAELATPDEAKLRTHVTDQSIAGLERCIDTVEAGLLPLRTFILPGGSEPAAKLHFARTVCRRAERAVVGLSGYETIRPQVVIYLNRLADLLFSLARRSNQIAGVPDIPWTAGDHA